MRRSGDVEGVDHVRDITHEMTILLPFFVRYQIPLLSRKPQAFGVLRPALAGRAAGLAEQPASITTAAQNHRRARSTVESYDAVGPRDSLPHVHPSGR